MRLEVPDGTKITNSLYVLYQGNRASPVNKRVRTVNRRRQCLRCIGPEHPLCTKFVHDNNVHNVMYRSLPRLVPLMGRDASILQNNFFPVCLTIAIPLHYTADAHLYIFSKSCTQLNAVLRAGAHLPHTSSNRWWNSIAGAPYFYRNHAVYLLWTMCTCLLVHGFAHLSLENYSSGLTQSACYLVVDCCTRMGPLTLHWHAVHCPVYKSYRKGPSHFRTPLI